MRARSMAPKAHTELKSGSKNTPDIKSNIEERSLKRSPPPNRERLFQRPRGTEPRTKLFRGNCVRARSCSLFLWRRVASGPRSLSFF